MSGWIALRIQLPLEVEDEILLAVNEAGTVGLQILGGAFPEPFVGAAPTARTAVAYFQAGTDLRSLMAKLSTLGGGLVENVDEVVEEPWVERQESARKPLPIGRRFIILPREADRREADAARIALVVPPRRAFGTGEHATTRHCLELLESTPLRGRSVLDVGTGSGILAMAAAALGASFVTAIDNDPEAIEIARETLVLNGFMVLMAQPDVRMRESGTDSSVSSEERAERGTLDPDTSIERRAPIDLKEGDLSVVTGRYPVILANIHASVLETASASMAALQAAGDHLILSGVSSEDASGLARVFGRLGYDEEARLESGEWTSMRWIRSK